MGTAIATGLFSVFVCAVLVTSYFRSLRVDPRDSKELAALKAALGKQPQDEALKERIRALDLRLRRAYLYHTRLGARGGWLLLGGLAAFVASLKTAATLRRKLPMPQAMRAEPGQGARAALDARRAVAAVAGILIGAAAVLAITSGGGLPRTPPSGTGISSAPQPGSPIDVPTPKEEGVAYPSMEEMRKHWPRFRGADGLGVSTHARVPTSWDGKTGQGILWKTAVPLSDPNSPVVWGDRVFLSGATEAKREVYAFDANTGKVLWQEAVANVPGSSPEPPEIEKEQGGCYAASTVATDGRRVFAIFANADVACLDVLGKRLWARNLGRLANKYGHGSSLVLWRNLLMVQLDQGERADEGKSRLLALDAGSGKTVWEAAKRPVKASWTTPIVIHTGKGEQLITAGNPWVIAYDPPKGTELWRVKCLGGDLVPSPVFGSGLLYATNKDVKLAAIRPDGKGDVTATHIAWSAEDNLPSICSPLVHDGLLYFLTTDSGGLTCLDAKSGQKVWEEDIEKAFLASPSLAGDRLYLVSTTGVTFMVAAGREYRLLGKAELGEDVMASPAFTDGRIYIRGKRHLFCIGEK